MTSPIAPAPAYETKQNQILTYRLGDKSWHLRQSDRSGETGSTLWLSAQVLCEYFIAEHGHTRNNPVVPPESAQTVLELGSGIGLTALVLQSLNLKVTATDTTVICEGFLRPNVMRNEIPHGENSIDVVELDWFKARGSIMNSQRFDYIVATDVVYESTLVPALCETIAVFATTNTAVYIAQEVRDPALFDSFIETMCNSGFKGSRVSHAKLRKIMRDRGWGDEAWEGVVLWRFRRKKTTLQT